MRWTRFSESEQNYLECGREGTGILSLPNDVSVTGPMSFRNWRRSLTGSPCFGVSEVPLYSDATICGEVRKGIGPYRLLNASPATPLDPAVLLVMESFLNPNDLPAMIETDTSNFTGAWLGDEIAALLALSSGARIIAGDATRNLHAGEWIISGDHDRPTLFPKRPGRQPILPRAVQHTQITPDSLGQYNALNASAATALVRAARLYRDGLWIAEVEPELTWLLFVSAIEVAAVYQQIEDIEPLEILRLSKPKLVARLASTPGLLHEVASALSRELRATNRFLEFSSRFMPAPPDKRPPIGFRLDWTASTLRRCMQKVYEQRSLALHEGIPFPPPMCGAPVFSEASWDAPVETVPGLAASTTGGVWKREDLPISLHTFEYVTRGLLQKWWADLAVNARDQEGG